MTLPQILYTAFAVLLAISFHEAAHALVAYKLGDPTPKYQGRLTLNPLAHLDLLGGLMLLIAHFGWAKPVQVNPANLKNPHRGMLWVALAGPVANVLVALALRLLLPVLPGLFPFSVAVQVQLLLTVSMTINLWLAAFNILPVPPLDGAKILTGLLPRRHAYTISQLQPYGPIILILLIVTGLAGVLINPVFNGLYNLIWI